MQIQIISGDIVIEAVLYDTPTGKAIADKLPVTGSVSTWGGELYFPVPVSMSLEPGSRDIMQPGELAYWPSGKMFCIFFGGTPAAVGDECRAASACNVFGKVEGPLDELWKIADGATIEVKCKE